MASRYHFAESRPSLGETLGTALGTGLGRGLTALAESKLDTMLRRQKHGQLSSQFQKMGIPASQADYLAQQDPETQWQAVRQWWMSQGYEGSDLPESISQDWQTQPSPLQELGNAEQPQLKQPRTAADLITQEGPMSPQIRQALEGLQLPQAQPQGASAAMQAIAPQAPLVPQALQAQEAPIPKMPKQRKARDLGEAFKIAQETTPQASKEAAQLRKEQRDIEKEINKETKAYYDNTLEIEESAKKADQRLNKMENLVKKGGLPDATYYNLWKNIEEHVSPTHGGAAGALVGAAVGSVIPVLGTAIGAAIGGALGGVVSPVATLVRANQRKKYPNTEQFEKLSADFVRDAKAIFGSRVTDQDLRAFMQMIPTLSNTDQGKLAIINNMRAFNKAAEVKAEMMKQIIKENGGKRPANLPILVEERAAKKLDKIARDFEIVA